MEDYGGRDGQIKITYKNGWKKRVVPKDVLYAHYEQITKDISICVTYNPLNKTLTGRDNKVGKLPYYVLSF